MDTEERTSLATGRILARYRVTEKQAGLRLDLFLKLCIPKMSRASIQEAIRARVGVPGRGRPRPSLALRPGDVVEVREAVLDEPPFPEDLVPAILHEDPDLVAVDKPAGLPVHSTRRVVRNQLVRWLRDRYGETLALAHRIDRETSGVVLSTRHAGAARSLARDFAAGRVHKEYLAVVRGVPPETFVVDSPVGPDLRSAVHIKQACVPGGSPARTRFVREGLAAGDRLALVRAFPETGRRHQIRVHLAAAGYPVLGDKLYAMGERHFLDFAARGPSERLTSALGARRHLLHAARLSFRHPATGDWLTLEAPLPADFAAALGGEAR